ncbi:hypothetical protein [Crateriforma conspicua]|uniref:hypothetical protein n=1 Tax=Crateriforma conspicua TaxID=2527996 RepID=UPI0011878AD5|nr:hypothetical protein [Crateriforma conspicua]QDV62608.1 hypothetical protein Mal65_17420 [Crateriforma conspicua]
MEGPKDELNPNAMTAEQTAALFTKLRRRKVDAAEVQTDIDAGAPTDAEGLLNVLTYTAWMLKEAGRGD